jgi:hypothetical protein
MRVDTRKSRFHNRNEAKHPLKEGRESVERNLEESISRALRENLAPLQRTANELQEAFADLVAACSSANPTDALPAMLRVQSSSSALAAGLSVLSNFVAVALTPPARRVIAQELVRQAAAAAVELHEKQQGISEVLPPQPEELLSEPDAQAQPVQGQGSEHPIAHESESAASEQKISVEIGAPEPVALGPVFDLSSFPTDIQDLHRRANRVAKVAMQDIKLLHPQDVQMGREHKDICERLRSDLDKARKEYDRRFRAIQDHPVDYFHRWMLEILAEGHAEALGEYPYPSPVLRH